MRSILSLAVCLSLASPVLAVEITPEQKPAPKSSMKFKLKKAAMLPVFVFGIGPLAGFISWKRMQEKK